MSKDSPHGTRQRYQSGCRCDECRAASAALEAARKRRIKATGAAPPKHGLSGYVNYGCRCATCIEARRTWEADMRASKGGEQPPQHGTASGYLLYKCRCDGCSKAIKRQKDEYRAKAAASASRRGLLWTSIELEVASREDLTSIEVALLLGRTHAGVEAVRKQLRGDPRKIKAAGRPQGEVPRGTNGGT